MNGRSGLNQRLPYTTILILEKDNRNRGKLKNGSAGTLGAGVAEHGQTSMGTKGLNARDSRSRPIGVRGFKSHPLHHQNLLERMP